MNKKYPIVTITGDEVLLINNKDVEFNKEEFSIIQSEPVTYTDSIVQITDVYTGEATLYDLQSNGVTQHCWQDPARPDNIHLVFMWNQTFGPPAQRRTKYQFSDDRGATWTGLGEVPPGASSGFPACYGLDDGRIVIANHSSPTGVVRTHIFIDMTIGGGNFTICDPGTDPALQKIWPRLVTTYSNKIVVIASKNTSADTVAFTTTGTCTFSGWAGNPSINNAEQYVLDRASNGTIGLAYIRNDFNPANQGDVMFISSTNDGLTWSAPVLVFDATPGPEFFGALRGIDLVYQGNTPKIVFDLIKQDDQGNFFPNICSRVMFWSPSINGGVAFAIADSTHHPCVFLGSRTPDDVFTNVCRGSVGRSSDGVYLWVAYNVARAERFDSVNYYDVYLAWSTNNGATWGGRRKLTNTSGPIRDCRYPSISPTNDLLTGNYYANIEYQNDSIPGSLVNGSAASLAKQRFLRVKLLFPIGIQNIGSEVPRDFSLHQNYPNPFNPKTIIKLEIPSNVKRETSNVKLIIYDILGKEVDVLVNEELKPGTYEVDFDGTEYPSGVYFYELRVTNDELTIEFKETKKMVLIR